MNNSGNNPTSPITQKPVERPNPGSMGHQPNTGNRPDEQKTFPEDPEAPVTAEGAGPQKESKAEGEDFEQLTKNNTIPAQDKRDAAEKAPLTTEESEENNDVDEQSPDSVLAGKEKNPDEKLVDKKDKYPFPNK